MCNVCGCGQGDGAKVEGDHEHVLPDGRVFRHVHLAGDHSHHHHHGHAHDHHGHAHDHHDHAHDDRDVRLVRVERDILAKNDALATQNRARFVERGVIAINLMSSPGSGKTSLLVRTLETLGSTIPVAVIEGDQQTSLDAERIRATGVPALQVNTGKGCHLDASMVGRAATRLEVPDGALLFIENVGNLVCPAGFDLGEQKRVVLCSVTEGEDKPAKYPDMFAFADLVIIHKIDLLPYVPIDVDVLEQGVRRIQPNAEILRVSTTTGEGFDAWLEWLRQLRRQVEAAE